MAGTVNNIEPGRIADAQPERYAVNASYSCRAQWTILPRCSSNASFFLDICVITDNYLISQQESALAHRTQVTQLVHVGTPDFIPPIFWPPNIPYDLNPADYDIWSVLNKEV